MKNLFSKIKNLFNKIFKPTYTCTMCGKTYPKPSVYKLVLKSKHCGYYNEDTHTVVKELCGKCYEEYARSE